MPLQLEDKDFKNLRMIYDKYPDEDITSILCPTSLVSFKAGLLKCHTSFLQIREYTVSCTGLPCNMCPLQSIDKLESTPKELIQRFLDGEPIQDKELEGLFG